MKKSIKIMGCLVALLGYTTIGQAAGAPPPGPGESHVPYEMEVFDTETEKQNAGTNLNAPGDTYRYTYLINDKYSNDPDYVLKRALLGVHIDDPDYSKEAGDVDKEWGSILIDGKALTTTSEPIASTDLVEIMSDAETPPLPPYIYNVTDNVIDDNKLVLQITNLNEDGTTDSDKPFGSFTVLRAGLHLYYAKK